MIQNIYDKILKKAPAIIIALGILMSTSIPAYAAYGSAKDVKNDDWLFLGNSFTNRGSTGDNIDENFQKFTGLESKDRVKYEGLSLWNLYMPSKAEKVSKAKDCRNKVTEKLINNKGKYEYIYIQGHSDGSPQKKNDQYIQAMTWLLDNYLKPYQPQAVIIQVVTPHKNITTSQQIGAYQKVQNHIRTLNMKGYIYNWSEKVESLSPRLASDNRHPSPMSYTVCWKGLAKEIYGITSESEKSTAESEISSKEIDKPSTPTGIKVSQGSSNTIKVKWNAISSTNVNGYKIRFSTSSDMSDPTTRAVYSRKDDTYTFPHHLKSGTTYYVQVKACYFNKNHDMLAQSKYSEALAIKIK